MADGKERRVGLSVKKRDGCAEMRGMTVGLVGEERKREWLVGGNRGGSEERLWGVALGGLCLPVRGRRW